MAIRINGKRVDGGSSPSAKTITATIPKGRMRGDIDGDGIISNKDVVKLAADDATTIQQYDEVTYWCADVNMTGEVDVGDITTLSQHLSNQGQFNVEDYYGNWMYDGTYYIDLSIPGISATSHDVHVVVSGEYPNGFFLSSECISGGIRIHTARCITVDTPCLITYKAGTGISLVSAERTILASENKPYSSGYLTAKGVDGVGLSLYTITSESTIPYEKGVRITILPDKTNSQGLVWLSINGEEGHEILLRDGVTSSSGISIPANWIQEKKPLTLMYAGGAWLTDIVNMPISGGTEDIGVGVPLQAGHFYVVYE